MAKEKNVAFSGWALVKRAGTGKRDRSKNEEQQPVAEETTVVDEQPHVEETRSEAETQALQLKSLK